MESTEKIKNIMLDNTVRTKNLVLELNPPKKSLKYFSLIYCKNLLNDHCVFIYWDEFLITIWR